MAGIIHRRRILAEHRARPAPHAGDDRCHGPEIILSLGIGETVGDVGIGFAEDVRHAVSVADDPDIMGFCGRRHCGIGEQRLPSRQPDQRSNNDCAGSKPDFAPNTHHNFPLPVPDIKPGRCR